MKSCTHCKHAQWDKTAAGRLHPSGDGKCGYVVAPLPKLPASMRWERWLDGPPKPMGGHINRHQQLRDHCTYFERGER